MWKFTTIFAVLMACELAANANQDLEHVVVNTLPEASIENVGTAGMPNFDSKRNYLIILSPTLDERNSGAVRIPRDIKEARAELRKALPVQYRERLRLSGAKDSDGRPYVACSSGDAETDRSVHAWMIIFWQLKSDSSPLRAFFVDHVGIENFEAIASDLFSDFCLAHAK